MRALQLECSPGLETSPAPRFPLSLLCSGCAMLPEASLLGGLARSGRPGLGSAQLQRLSWNDGCPAACSLVLRAAERSILLTARPC